MIQKRFFLRKTIIIKSIFKLKTMNDITQISLQTKSILNVPLRNYEDFWFIVNGKKFKTTRIISDLLSPLICQIHSTDPTMSEFIINTKGNGDFEKVLQLANFNEEEISQNELPFFSEIFEILETETININSQDQINNNNNENTIENVLNRLYKRTKYSIIDQKFIENEINFASSHFYEILEKQEQDEFESNYYYGLERISNDILERILENSNLKLNEEDQLLTFINHLYSTDRNYSNLYKFVHFEYISSDKMNDFLNEFDINDLTNETWQSISIRLKQEIKQLNKNDKIDKNRYQSNKAFKSGKLFEFNSNDPFNGINNFLVKSSNGKIEDKICISSSNYRSNSKPENVVLYENQNIFQSQSVENAFICFDYIEHKVIPKNYVIKSADFDENVYHPKSWVVEGSNDNSKWEICDEQNSNFSLNGNNIVQMFQIKNESNKEFRYIRIRQTQKNCGGDNDLMIQSFELFGTLI